MVEGGPGAARDADAAHYRAAVARRVAARAPAACAVLAACAAIATVFEILRFPERRTWMLGADAVFAVVIAATLWGVRRRPSAAPLLLVIATNIVGVLLNGYHGVTQASVAMCIWTLTALLASTSFLLPWGWRWHAAACVGVVVTYPLMLDPGGADALTWAVGGAYLSWVVALSTTAAGLLDSYLRTDFELTAELSEREARLQSYFDLALVGTAIVSPAREWIEVNDEFCRILGHRRDRLLGTVWPEFIEPADRGAEREFFQAALEATVARASGELRLTRADGAVVNALVSMRGLPGRAGGIDHVMILVQDITERSRREAALRQARDAAEAGQRTKSAFLALVSHELRTPMTIISGMTDIVLDGDLAPDQRRALQKTKEATTTLVTLVNDVLDLSKIDAGKLPLRPRSVELRTWVDGIVQPLAWLAEQRGLAFDLVVDEEVPAYIVTDPDRLRQIVVNLIDNAIKFTDRGSVHVQIEPYDDGRLLLIVADTGCGIPANKQDAIFDAFTQLEVPTILAGRGSGLGLSICRRLTELLGGRIWVDSAEREGSRFHVLFPVVLPAPVPALAADAPSKAAGTA